MKVSVAMCVYNGALYVGEQLKSIMNQATKVHEVIVIDDFSSDNTYEKCLSLLGNDCQSYRVFRNSHNLGFTSNFQKAISLCTGDLIFISDQDDVWLENKVTVLVDYFTRYPEIACLTHDGELVDERLRKSGLTKNNQIRNGYGRKKFVITGCLTALRKEYLEFILPVPTFVIGHDTWLTYIFELFPRRFKLIDDCLQLVRRHSENTSNWVINSTSPVNRIHVLAEQVKTLKNSAYKDRESMNNELTRRLASVKNVTDLFDQQEVETALKILESEKIAIHKRVQLTEISNSSKRKLKAVQLLFGGYYRHFNGFPSFLRDLLR
jgi:glycosyltransferase involved in cell wall biosynthesis